MSNALKTSKTEFVGLRLPHDIVARSKEIGPNMTQAISAACRQAWFDLPAEVDRLTRERDEALEFFADERRQHNETLDQLAEARSALIDRPALAFPSAPVGSLVKAKGRT